MTAQTSTGYGSVGSTSSSLLERVKVRDQDAWRRMVRVYGPLVLFWCRRAGVPPDDRPDVFQESFRAVARHVGDFQRERRGSFRAWLRSIVRTKTADHFVRRGVNRGAAGGTEAYRRLLEVPQKSATSDAGSISASEETLVFRQALAIIRSEFEERTWEAFWRTTIDGRSATDVAEAMGMTPAAVRKAKSRVLQRLRAEMEDLLE